MKDLHWLKIPEHIQFKVLVTIYQCVNHLVPSFVIDLLVLNLTRRNLRFYTQGKPAIPWCNLSQLSNSLIMYAGPRLWNELPQNIRDPNMFGAFKIPLKHISSVNVLTVDMFKIHVQSGWVEFDQGESNLQLLKIPPKTYQFSKCFNC